MLDLFVCIAFLVGAILGTLHGTNAIFAALILVVVVGVTGMIRELRR